MVGDDRDQPQPLSTVIAIQNKEGDFSLSEKVQTPKEMQKVEMIKQPVCVCVYTHKTYIHAYVCVYAMHAYDVEELYIFILCF